jgi:hypothetical protein
MVVISMSKRAPVYILEGTWWSNHEVPLILPYFHALATSHREIDLSHRTIRGADDIAYYVSKISRNAGAFLYFACHGKRQRLSPSDGRSTVPPEELLAALSQAKAGAIAFVHFGCCEMVATSARRQTHEKISGATGARWVSGYTTPVDWLQSTLLDIALVSEVFVPDHQAKAKQGRKLKPRAEQFIKNYEQLARELGFSALAETSSGQLLFPERLHTS